MTNLDDLAKLAPFGFDNITRLRSSDVFDALNEWVELRAELCAAVDYRERTEAALREVCGHFDDDPILTMAMHASGLWRDPAPKEDTNGN